LAVFVFSSSWIGRGDLGELRWTALLVFVGNRFPNLFLFFGCNTEVGVAKRTNTTRKDSSGKRTNDVSPEAAGRLAEMAREMRELVYGEPAYPKWGTRFSEIESEGMNLGLELAPDVHGAVGA
jgi:hypothetical protein